MRTRVGSVIQPCVSGISPMIRRAFVSNCQLQVTGFKGQLAITEVCHNRCNVAQASGNHCKGVVKSWRLVKS